MHKATPQTLKLQEILRKKDYVGMDFVGVRSAESLRRSKYSVEAFGKKQKGQYIANAILEWSSAEVWLYIFFRNLLINRAYLKGNARVGCLLCPLGIGKKSDWVTIKAYPEKVKCFLDIVKKSINDENSESYIRNNAWVARKNGRDIQFAPQNYKEETNSDQLIISFQKAKTDWKEWIKTLPTLPSTYDVEEDGDKVKIIFPQSAVEIPNLKSVFHKAAYCVGCRTCEINCPHGAISFDEQGVHIENCRHCGTCHDIDGGCIAYHSLRLSSTNGGHTMKSLNTMANHAPKLMWVYDFFSQGDAFFQENSLGSVQKNIFRRFLSDANLTIKGKPQTTSFFEFITAKTGQDTPDAWAFILINLVNNNPQIRWYIKKMPVGKVFLSEEIEDELIINHSVNKNDASSIRRAFGRLCEMQLGTKLRFGEYRIEEGKKSAKERKIFLKRTKTVMPDPRVILYGLYVFAEACGGYYEFTLSRLMDFDVESNGVSPAEIFGLTRDEMEQYLHDLTRMAGEEFLSFTTTYGLDIVGLKADKKAEDVLTLFC